MGSERLKYSIANAKTSLLFYFVMLAVNLVSRRIFLDMLGDSAMGTAATMQRTVGLLNMAEMGITTSITCALFAPIYRQDREEINRIVSLFCYLFRLVGVAILVIGAGISFFTPILIEGEVSRLYIYASFFTFLFTTSLGYFFNYKQFLLLASQKTYIVTRITNYVLIAKIVCQVIAIRFLGAGYLSWLALEAVFALLFTLVLERRVGREYPWLSPSYALGRRIRKEYRYIFRNMKQVVSHKIANVMLTQTDTLIVSKMISVVMVTFYVNYAMIATKIVTLTGSMFSGVWASVGHLISEGDSRKIRLVFRQFSAISFFIGGVVSLCVWHLASPFISFMFGERYVLSDDILFCIVAAMFVSIVRQPLLVFLNGYSLYRDVWAAWCEAGLNLCISIAGAYYWGLLGVVLGTAVSTGLISLGWKPYFLFRNAFRMSPRGYYLSFLKYMAMLAVTAWAAARLLDLAGGVSCSGFGGFLLYASALFGFSSVVYGGLLYAASPAMREAVRLGWQVVRKKR